MLSRFWEPISSLEDSAIEYLRTKRIDPSDEHELLNALEKSPTSTAGFHAIMRLGNSGIATRSSLPLLKSLCVHRKEDVQVTALAAVDRVAGSAELEFYRELAVNPKRRMRHFMYDSDFVIGRWGDASDLASAIDLLKRTYNKKRLSDWLGADTPLTAVLGFISEFTQEPSAEHAIKWVKSKWTNVPAGEQNATCSRIPELAIDPPANWVCIIGTPNRWGQWISKSFRFEDDFGTLGIDITHPRCRAQCDRAAQFANCVIILDDKVTHNDCFRSSALNSLPIVDAPAPAEPLNMANRQPWYGACNAVVNRVSAFLRRG